MLLICLLLSGVLAAQTIIINEVMFDAVGADFYDEFIEIVNNGDSAISLQGTYLLINGSVDTLDFPNSDTIAPNSYALILDIDYHNSGTYDEIIPENTLLLTIQDKYFADKGLSDNESDTLFLISEFGDTLGSVITTPDQDAGYSDEKIDLFGDDEPANWGNSVSLYGTPGYENSIAMKDLDLAIAEIARRDDTSQLNPGCTVEFSIKIKNLGRETISNTEIQFGDDLNRDTLLQNTEVISVDIITVSPGDSVVLYPGLVEVQSGKHTLLSVITTEDDNPDNNKAMYFLKVSYPRSSVVINEFMYAPKTGFGGEWIELLNVSEDTVNVIDWTISDASDSVVITDEDVLIPPDTFVVLSSDSILLDYWNIGGFFIRCMKSIPTLNNTIDSIVVRDLCGHVIDSLKYSSSWGYQLGVSLERIDPYRDSEESENWTLSQNLEGGTPGYKNSVAIKDFDLAVSGIGLLAGAANPQAGGTAALYVTIKNIGREIMNNAGFHLGIDNNRDSLLQQNEVLYVDILTVEPGDSIVLYPSILDVRSGINPVIGSIESEDDNPGNNTYLFDLPVPYHSGCIVINEFMYVPKVDFGGEWVELMNISEDTVNMINWAISDNASSVDITDANVLIPPETYIVLSSDSTLLDCWHIGGVYIHCMKSIPTLNNTSDSIVVRDLCGYVIDSLKYSSSWGYQNGVSLERINPYRDSDASENWTLSIDSSGGTPGYFNSQMIKTNDLLIDTIYVVSEDLIHGESVEFEYIVGNNGLAEIYTYSVYLGVKPVAWAPENTTVKDTILYYETPIQTGSRQKKSIVFESMPGGIYWGYCEVFCSGEEQISNDRDSCNFIVGYPEHSIVVNEVMNIPESGEAEWFELFNTSDINIDFNQFLFRDAGGGWRALTAETEIIKPGEFCIVAARTDFRQTYPQFSGSLIVPETFPLLNNSSDSLFLASGSGRLIEAVYFQQDWGGGAGISIERKDPNSSAMSEFNWGGSINSTGATPGLENSILKYKKDLKIIPESFRFMDSTVAIIRPAIFQIGVINSGSQATNIFSLEIYHDVNGDDNASLGEMVWSLPNISPLLPDSTILLDGEIYSERSGRCHFWAIITMTGDENTKDNIATTDLLVAFSKQSVVINEFLAYPNVDQVEFIELVTCVDNGINLNEWRLEDSRSAVSLVHLETLEAGEYLVLAEDSSFFEFFSANNLQVIIPDKWPGLSNTNDEIIICDLTGKVIDSLAYNDEWGVAAGLSLEKRLPEDMSAQDHFWSQSQAAVGATPGADNSIMPRQYDLSLDSALVGGYDNNIETEAKILCWFSNKGQRSCSSAPIIIQESRHTVATKNTGEIVPGGRDSVTINIGAFESGVHRLQVFVDWSEDTNHENDTLNKEIRTAYPAGALLLSEFLATPTDVITESESNTEYIEIYNPLQEIQLEGWMICDENTGAPVKIQEQKIVTNGEYFVIAADSSIFNYPQMNSSGAVILVKFPSLNNTADAIYIKDPTGKTIDSLVYDQEWAIPQYVSMERIYFINPNTLRNWRFSTDPTGGTPGYKNSVAIDDDTSKLGIKASPNPFSPNGDGVDDEIAIIYQLPFPSACVSVQIYDLMGRLIYEPAQNIISSSEGAVYWDGSRNHGNRARIGMYVVRCSATDIMSDKTVGYITTIVLAR